MKRIIWCILAAFLITESVAFAQEKIYDATLQNAATGTGDGSVMNVRGYTTVQPDIVISDTATVTFEVLSQGSSTWRSRTCVLSSSTAGSLVTSATASGSYQCSVAGFSWFRARVSSFGAGTITVTARATTAVSSIGGGGGGGGTSVAEDSAHSNGEDIVPIGCRRIDTAASSAGTSGDWATVDCDGSGALRVRIDSSAVGGNSQDEDGTVAAGNTSDTEVISKEYKYDGTNWKRAGYDPCQGPKTHISFSISTATTTELTPSLAGASTYWYVCSIDLITASANNVALVDDDTDGCGSPTAGLAGGVTAATGWNLAANGGIVKGNGSGTVFKSPTANSVLCLMTSAAVQLSGSIQVVAAP